MPDFHDYCYGQVERLIGAFPAMRFYPPAALNELANWLEERACGDEGKAAALITEATEFEEAPSIAQLKAIWNRIFPPPKPKEASARCADCSGTGWVFVETGEYSGVKPCLCGVPPAADPQREYAPVNLGIRKEMP